MPVIARRAYRPKEIAQMTGVPEDTVRFWIRNGNLPSVKIGRCVFVPAEAVDALLPEPGADQALSA